MPDEGEREGSYRLAQVHRSLLRPHVLNKARRRVFVRLFDAIHSGSVCTHYLFLHYTKLVPSDSAVNQFVRKCMLCASSIPLGLTREEEGRLIVETKALIDVLKRDPRTWPVSNVNLALWILNDDHAYDPYYWNHVDHSVSLDPTLSVCDYYDVDQKRLCWVLQIATHRLNAWENCFLHRERAALSSYLDSYRTFCMHSLLGQRNRRMPHIRRYSSREAIQWTFLGMPYCFTHIDVMMTDFRRGLRSPLPPLAGVRTER
jgi:hypothetical protein